MARNKRGEGRRWALKKANDKREFRRMTTDRKNGTTAYVYVLELGHEGLYKIGMTGNLAQRVKELRAANPKVREVIACRVKDAGHKEAVLHTRLRRRRVEREVFRLESSDLPAIRRYLENPPSGLSISEDLPELGE